MTGSLVFVDLCRMLKSLLHSIPILLSVIKPDMHHTYIGGVWIPAEQRVNTPAHTDSGLAAWSSDGVRFERISGLSLGWPAQPGQSDSDRCLEVG